MASAFIRIEKRFNAITGHAIYGPWKRSSTLPGPLAKRQRSDTNLTAALTFNYARDIVPARVTLVRILFSV